MTTHGEAVTLQLPAAEEAEGLNLSAGDFPLSMALLAILAAVCGAWASKVISKVDWTSKKASDTAGLTTKLAELIEKLDGRQDKTADKGANTAEELRAIAARVDAVESTAESLAQGVVKIADILERLARMEERHAAQVPRLDRADATADAMIAVGEQVRTVFKRLDAISEQITDLADATAQKTARQLWEMIQQARDDRGQQSARAN